MYTIIHSQTLSGAQVPVMDTASTYSEALMKLHQALASDYASETVEEAFVTIIGPDGNALDTQRK